MMGNAVLIFNSAAIRTFFERSTGLAKPVVGQELFFTVLVVAVQILAEQVGCFMDLVHGLDAMAMIIMVTGGQDAIGTVQHARFRRIAEFHWFEIG